LAGQERRPGEDGPVRAEKAARIGEPGGPVSARESKPQDSSVRKRNESGGFEFGAYCTILDPVPDKALSVPLVV
jgi:hypothetical protein